MSVAAGEEPESSRLSLIRLMNILEWMASSFFSTRCKDELDSLYLRGYMALSPISSISFEQYDISPSTDMASSPHMSWFSCPLLMAIPDDT